MKDRVPLRLEGGMGCVVQEMESEDEKDIGGDGGCVPAVR